MQDVPALGKSIPTTTPVHRRPSRAPLVAPPPLAPADAEPVRLPDAPETATGSIIDRHPDSPVVHITFETEVSGATADALWEAYYANFLPLGPLAILQHCYPREEVMAEFANPRITKIIGWQDGVPVGLAMVTNSLDDVPQISPAFLRAKYPEHAAADTIYFGILVMVAPGVRGLTLFSRLSVELWQIPARAGGVLIYDICDFNRITFDADTLSQRIADNFPRSSVGVIDRQTWYAAELPLPIPDRPTPPSPEQL
ncbi:MAG: hypothetical protein JWM34_493 [Ilumatobacteraceae bacterium]|nr:hypothetical protein [Ilumatobacteraceae bacterium]